MFKMVTAIASMLFLLGCTDLDYKRADKVLLCSMKGEAFYSEHRLGVTSTVRRIIDADKLCEEITMAVRSDPTGTGGVTYSFERLTESE